MFGYESHTILPTYINATNQRRCTPIQDHSPAANSKHVTATDVAMITCTKCQKTLPASQFAKAQQKKHKKGKACWCLGCSRGKGAVEVSVQHGVSPPSSAPLDKVCNAQHIAQCTMHLHQYRARAHTHVSANCLGRGELILMPALQSDTSIDLLSCA